MNTLAHVRDVEVEKQTQRKAAQLQVRQHLGAMDRQHFFHTFDFDDQATLDDEVDTISGLQLDSAVHDGQPNLVLKMQAGLRELVVHARIARTFENAGTES